MDRSYGGFRREQIANRNALDRTNLQTRISNAKAKNVLNCTHGNDATCSTPYLSFMVSQFPLRQAVSYQAPLHDETGRQFRFS